MAVDRRQFNLGIYRKTDRRRRKKFPRDPAQSLRTSHCLQSEIPRQMCIADEKFANSALANKRLRRTFERRNPIRLRRIHGARPHAGIEAENPSAIYLLANLFAGEISRSNSVASNDDRLGTFRHEESRQVRADKCVARK